MRARENCLFPAKSETQKDEPTGQGAGQASVSFAITGLKGPTQDGRGRNVAVGENKGQDMARTDVSTLHRRRLEDSAALTRKDLGPPSCGDEDVASLAAEER